MILVEFQIEAGFISIVPAAVIIILHLCAQSQELPSIFFEIVETDKITSGSLYIITYFLEDCKPKNKISSHNYFIITALKFLSIHLLLIKNSRHTIAI